MGVFFVLVTLVWVWLDGCLGRWHCANDQVFGSMTGHIVDGREMIDGYA